MLALAALAARMQSDPEWANVPSPRFWVKWGTSTNGSMPTHCTPSPPIWVLPISVPTRFGSMRVTRPWQPMPEPTSSPSGTLVPVECGQPEQKYGVRVGRMSSFFLTDLGLIGVRRASSIFTVRRRRSGSTR